MAIPGKKKSARKGEMSSCNVNASARGLAWAACIMANKGVDPEGKRIMSEESWKKMHLNPKVAPDNFGGRLALVGICYTTLNLQFNPEKKAKKRG